MTEQQYGRAIVRGEQSFWIGDGKPDWLPGDVMCQVWFNVAAEWSEEGKASWWYFCTGQFRLPLPQHQFVYDALDRGFKPCFGGDEAPGDWNGGRVLLSSGSVFQRYQADEGIEDWTHSRSETGCLDLGVVIGYHPRISARTDGADEKWPMADARQYATPVAENSTSALAGEPKTADDTIHTGYAKFEDEPLPTYDPAVFGIYNKSTHVPVRMMTMAEARYIWPIHDCVDIWLGALRSLNQDIIRPDPDPAKVIADKYSDLSGAVMKEMGK